MRREKLGSGFIELAPSMRVIEPAEIWEYVQLLEVPKEPVVAEDLSENENNLLNASLEVMRLVNKPSGQRRSANGLNRIAQNRHPEMKWDCTDIDCIAEAWKIAGLLSLIDAIRGARKLPANCGRVSYVRPKLSESVATCLESGSASEAFVSSESMVKAMKLTEPKRLLYSIAAKTNYGKYHFCLLSIEPPSVSATERLCISHNLFSSSVERQRIAKL